MQIHVTARGETLYAIGRRYGVAPGLIARFNGLRDGAALAVENGVIAFDARPCGLFAIRAEMA